MLLTRRMVPFAAAATLCAFSLLPAATAAAATASKPPADCSETRINSRTVSLTCTSRPATQQWRYEVLCTGGWFDTSALGNIVTGNGTSTAVCPAGSFAQTPGWFVV
jgi:hypothetical protein